MGVKRKKKTYVHALINGIFDIKNKKLVKVSLDAEEMELEIALMGMQDRYARCEFDVRLAV